MDTYGEFTLQSIGMEDRLLFIKNQSHVHVRWSRINVRFWSDTHNGRESSFAMKTMPCVHLGYWQETMSFQKKWLICWATSGEYHLPTDTRSVFESVLQVPGCGN